MNTMKTLPPIHPAKDGAKIKYIREIGRHSSWSAVFGFVIALLSFALSFAASLRCVYKTLRSALSWN